MNHCSMNRAVHRLLFGLASSLVFAGCNAGDPSDIEESDAEDPSSIEDEPADVREQYCAPGLPCDVPPGTLSGPDLLPITTSCVREGGSYFVQVHNAGNEPSGTFTFRVQSAMHLPNTADFVTALAAGSTQTFQLPGNCYANAGCKVTLTADATGAVWETNEANNKVSFVCPRNAF